MFKVNIELIVGCTDTLINNDNKFLMDGGKPPLKELDVSKQPKETAKDIVKEYMEVSPHWPEYRLLRCYTLDNELRIVYGIMIPYNIKLEKGEWYDVDKITTNCDKLVQKVVYEASLRI